MGTLVFDKRNRVLYFTDTLNRQLESYDLKTMKRNVIYRNLDNPKNLRIATSDKNDETYE